MTTHAMRVHEYGGPEAMRFEEIAVARPGPGEALIRQTAIGLNFIDVYQRTGFYPVPLPFIPGNEAAGVVEAVGEGVTDLAEGDRVAYVNGSAYTERRVIDASKLVKVPAGVDDKTAAAMMLKGMTARYLLRATFDVTAGTTLLFHAAAGGVGLIAGQWAKALGATTIIGTVGSAEKAALALAHGYTHVIDYSKESFVDRVKEITGGRGVDVVYDSIGKDTYPASLDCLKPRGLWVSFGQASGALPPVDTGLLARKGSLFMTRPTIFSYIGTRPELVETANDLFDVVASGKVTIEVNQEYALKDAGQAHADLVARKTTGSTVILP